MVKRNYYYVGVYENGCVQLVTDHSSSGRFCSWDHDTELEPEEFSKSTAADIAEGLVLNGFRAFIVQSPIAITQQFTYHPNKEKAK